MNTFYCQQINEQFSKDFKDYKLYKIKIFSVSGDIAWYTKKFLQPRVELKSKNYVYISCNQKSFTK